MQSSKLLEIKPSVFSSLFPLHTKNNACVCTLDSCITSTRVSYDQGCKASLFPGNQHPRTEAKGHTPGHHLETIWLMVDPVPAAGTLIAEPTCSSWSWTVTTTLPVACIVVFLTVFYRRTREESWKDPPSYLLLVFLTAKPSLSPSLARATQQGLRTAAASLLGEQKSNDSHRTDQPFQLRPFTQQTGPTLGIL